MQIDLCICDILLCNKVIIFSIGINICDIYIYLFFIKACNF